MDDGMLCCIMLSSWPKRVDDGAKQDNIGMLFLLRTTLSLFNGFHKCFLGLIDFGWVLWGLLRVFRILDRLDIC